jgi:outer membrane protein insertion porin family
MTRRSFRALSALAVVCLAAAAATAEPARIAVLPVVIHSIEEAGYLREGIAEMLSSRLGQQDGLAVVKIADASAATQDVDAARAAGSAAGADWVLFGSFTRFGEGASLDLRCVPVASSGVASPRSVFVQAGNLSELIPRLESVVDRIATHVRGGAPAAVAGAPDGSNLNDVLSELEALRQRVEALEARVPAAQANAAGGASATN